MKANIEIDIKPFTTPNFVKAKERSNNESLDGTVIHLKELDPGTLEKLCDEFRDEVFRKAGKSRPPQQALLCPKCGEG